MKISTKKQIDVFEGSDFLNMLDPTPSSIASCLSKKQVNTFSNESQRVVTTCHRDNHLILCYIFKHFIESTSFSCKRSNAIFLLHDFFKCTTTEFKSASISLDIFLQDLIFVTFITLS